MLLRLPITRFPAPKEPPRGEFTAAGFAGTVQAFVPDENVDGYKSGMEAVFGAGSCAVLKVRPEGCTAVL